MKILLRIVLGLVVVLGMGVVIALVLNARRESRLVERFPPPGQMVDIGGRRLHLQCEGPDTKPVVILESGAFGQTIWYRTAFDEVAQVARVCMYERAGLGWSDEVPLPRSLGSRVDDLHALLQKGDVSPPYILAGHSMGGLLARMYIKSYPEEVAGLVLIESSEEHFNTTERSQQQSAASAKQMGTGALLLSLGVEISQVRFPNAPPELDIMQRASVFRAGQDDMMTMSHLKQELQSFGELGTLGDLPLVVIQQGKPDPNRTAELAKEWSDAQARLAALSTRSVALVAEKSWHSVMVDQPELYRVGVSKVLEMLTSSDTSKMTATPLSGAAH
jgi:pimeloyl-ACP methyl ester carboxylesterase